jgi:hypothetical protein
MTMTETPVRTMLAAMSDRSLFQAVWPVLARGFRDARSCKTLTLRLDRTR